MSEQERMELARAINAVNESEEYITVSKDQFHKAMADAVAEEVSSNNNMLRENDKEEMDPMLSILLVMTTASVAQRAWKALSGQEESDK